MLMLWSRQSHAMTDSEVGVPNSFFSHAVGSWGFLLAAVLGVVGSLFLLRSCYGGHGRKKRKYNLPPGPRGLPILGNLLTLFTARELPHRALLDLAKKYGPIYRLNLGQVRSVYVSDAAIARQVFKDHDRAITSRPNHMAALKYLNYGTLHIALAPYGTYWQMLRRVLQLELMTAKRLQQFSPVRIEELNKLVQQVLQAAKSSSAINMHEQFSSFTLANVSRMAVGKNILEYDLTTTDSAGAVAGKYGDILPWREAVEKIVSLFGCVVVEDFLPALAWIDVLSGVRGEMRRVFRSVDQHLQHMVDQHKQRLQKLQQEDAEAVVEAHDFIDVLLLSKERPPGDDCVKAVAVEFITAGADTTALTMEWALSELMDNPDCMRRAQEEVDAVVGKERAVEEEDTAHMPFLRACLKESMRLHVTFPMLVPRSPTEDITVGGYDVPAGTMLIFQAWGMARDGAVWEDPLRFNPDRFMGAGGHIDVKGQHQELMPFGSGRRICPGMNLALTVMHVTLARLIHSFDWGLPQGTQKLDMVEKYVLGIHRRSPLLAVPTTRLPAHLYSSK